MLTGQQVEEYLSSGYELQGFELKGPGARTDNHLFAKVTRAALSMGNLRDGGHIVIGIDDKDPAAMHPGLDPAQLASWLSYDDVAARMATYSDPPLQLAIASVTLSSGATVAVIGVAEFLDLPHICKKDFPDVLRAGALYVRPRKKPETSEVASSVEMRDLISLAVEKGLRAYVETAEKAKVTLALASAGPDDADHFAAQRAGAWN